MLNCKHVSLTWLLIPKGRVIRATFFNFSRNIVALQVEKRCCPYYHRVLNLPRNKFQCCKLKNLLQKVELGSTLRNILLKLATLTFVAWQVEHAVVMGATTRSLQRNNVARQVGLTQHDYLLYTIYCSPLDGSWFVANQLALSSTIVNIRKWL